MSKKDPDDKRKMPELSETERIEMERMLVERAFKNSYALLTKKIKLDQILSTKELYGSGITGLLMYDPELGPDKEDVEDILQYFEEEEEYEKCVELKKILDEYI